MPNHRLHHCLFTHPRTTEGKPMRSDDSSLATLTALTAVGSTFTAGQKNISFLYKFDSPILCAPFFRAVIRDRIILTMANRR